MHAKTAILVFLVLLGAFFVLAPGAAVAAQDGDYIYTTSGSPAVATITGYVGAGGDITIPSTLGGYATAAVGDDAFNSAKGHLVTSVTIPSSVTSIGNNAFYDCTSLASVTIPSSLTSIGNYAFSYCTALTAIERLNPIPFEIRLPMVSSCPETRCQEGMSVPDRVSSASLVGGI